MSKGNIDVLAQTRLPVEVHVEFRIYMYTCVFVMVDTYTFTKVEGKAAREALQSQFNVIFILDTYLMMYTHT